MRPSPRSHRTSIDAVARSVAVRTWATPAASPTGASALRVAVRSSSAAAGSSVSAAAAGWSPVDQADTNAVTVSCGPSSPNSPQPATPRNARSATTSAGRRIALRAGVDSTDTTQNRIVAKLPICVKPTLAYAQRATWLKPLT